MPKKRRFPLEAMEAAVTAAGLSDAQVLKFLAALKAWRPKVGRHPDDDDEDVKAAIGLLLCEACKNPHAASVRVTQRFPEHARKAAKKRIYKKVRNAWAAALQAEGGRVRLAEVKKRIEEHEQQIKEWEEQKNRNQAQGSGARNTTKHDLE